MAYPHGSCDSYFVESHEDRGRSYREALRERERHVKQQTQLAIAEELSQLVSFEYCRDVVEHMEAMEVKRAKAKYTAHADDPHSSKHCQMLHRLKSKQRFSGSCVRTYLTSWLKLILPLGFCQKPCSWLSTFSIDTAPNASSTSDTTSLLGVLHCLLLPSTAIARSVCLQFGSLGACVVLFTMTTCSLRWNGTCCRHWDGPSVILPSTVSYKLHSMDYPTTRKSSIWLAISRRLQCSTRTLSPNFLPRWLVRLWVWHDASLTDLSRYPLNGHLTTNQTP